MDTYEDGRLMPDFHPDCDAIAVNADKVWFAQNPTRRFRARLRFPGELAGPGDTHVITRRIGPGARERLSFQWSGGPLPDDDVSIGRLFELLSRGEIALHYEGAVFPWRHARGARN